MREKRLLHWITTDDKLETTLNQRLGALRSLYVCVCARVCVRQRVRGKGFVPGVFLNESLCCFRDVVTQ